MLNLPVYLRAGSYYLHTRIGSRQFKRSLRTADPAIARLRALELLRVLAMNSPKLSDFNFDSEALRRYEIELGGVRIKATDEADHRRAMEAITALQSLPSTQAATVAPPAVAAPSVTSAATSGHSGALNLYELLEKYLDMKTLAKGTIPAVKNAVWQFAAHVGKARTIDQIYKHDVSAFAELMKKNGLALQTIQTRINLLKAVFNFSIEYSYLRGNNPVVLKVMTKAQKLEASHEIFDDKHIEEIFKEDYFLKEKVKDPSYFFGCVLAATTGIRTGAINQLCCEDIQKTNTGNWFLRIRSDKTKSGKRDVPVAQEIFDFGFEDFIKNRTGPVFSYFKLNDDKGNALGKKFTRRLQAIGLDKKGYVFHSLRGYANDFCAKNGVALEARCQVFGHEINNINVDYYTKKYTVDQLSEIIAPAQKQILLKLLKK